MPSKIPMPEADSLLDLAAVRREFRGLGFANNFGDARGASCERLVRFDLDEAKHGGLFDFPFPHAKRAGKFTHGQSPALLLRMRWMRSRRSRLSVRGRMINAGHQPSRSQDGENVISANACMGKSCITRAGLAIDLLKQRLADTFRFI